MSIQLYWTVKLINFSCNLTIIIGTYIISGKEWFNDLNNNWILKVVLISDIVLIG